MQICKTLIVFFAIWGTCWSGLHAQDLSTYGSCLDGFSPDDSTWQHVKYDFFRHKASGLIGYFTCSADSQVVYYSLPAGLDVDSYIDLGYYGMDNSRIYARLPMASGNMLYVFDEADFATFIAYAVSPYARDKDHVYYLGETVYGADPATFEVLPANYTLGWPPLGRDKSHIYAWGEVLEDVNEVPGLKEYLERQ